MPEETTTPTTPATEPEAVGQQAETTAEPTQEAPETTPAKSSYDFGKFQKAIEEGKLTTDLLEDVYAHGPGWIANINKANKQAVDERNKVQALRAELEKLKNAPATYNQKIEKPEDHPGVQAMRRITEAMIREGMDKEYAQSLMDKAIQHARDEIERQEFIRKDEIDRLFEERARKQEETDQLNSAATQLAERYKVDADDAVTLIAAFQGEDTPQDGLRKALAFIEMIREAAQKEQKPKPKPTIIPPGPAQVTPTALNDEDRWMAQKQAEVTARYVK